MTRANKGKIPVFETGRKITKKALLEYHDNPVYQIWNPEMKQWDSRRLADRLPSNMIVVENKKTDKSCVITIEGDDARVVWVEVPNGKSGGLIARPKVLPLNRENTKV